MKSYTQMINNTGAIDIYIYIGGALCMNLKTILYAIQGGERGEVVYVYDVNNMKNTIMYAKTTYF
ncbi:MAG: hypothetical protein MJE68_21595 [Proteobacteria bacterium]|nr:hypothetical protein [Pseudomonadota bacterium]